MSYRRKQRSLFSCDGSFIIEPDQFPILQDLTKETYIEDNFGKHLPLLDILSLSIKFMKDHALKYLADNGVPYPEAETKWVITVPAIWNDPAKVLTRNAAEKVTC